MTGTISVHFIVVVNLSPLSSFKRTPPPRKLFRDKRVTFFLVCIGSCQEVDQVFVYGEDQAFFKGDYSLTKL